MNSLYMKANKEDISKYVLFSGDPWRVETVAKILDNAKHIGFYREYNTYTGFYKGVRITVTSTGIGSASAAIAMEEMYECGMKVAVRMGTVMSMDDNLLGQFIIPVASMREEYTSDTYAPKSYPAVSDIRLLEYMNKSVSSLGYKYSNGINCSMDGFYTKMHESKFSKEKNVDIESTFKKLKSLNVVGIDMESSCMLTIGRLMNVKTSVVTAVTVLENLKKTLEGEARKKLESDLCLASLEGIYQYNIGG